jgi:hypothetical protein
LQRRCAGTVEMAATDGAKLTVASVATGGMVAAAALMVRSEAARGWLWS